MTPTSSSGFSGTTGGAADFIGRVQHPHFSLVSYLELLQGAKDREEVSRIRSFLADLRFVVLPVSENVGERAATYMEEYALSGGLGALDALIAATAVENDLPLATANRKHFAMIRGLRVAVFRP